MREPSGSFDWRAEVRARLRDANLDPASEAEIVDELSQHLEDQESDIVARGRTPEAARAELLAGLDDETSKFPHGILERRRARRAREAAPVGARPNVGGFFASVKHDLVYGARGLARAPVLTGTIVLSLGIVIGANTTIFGLMDSLFVRRLPLPHPEQLVAFYPTVAHNPALLSYADYKSLKDASGLRQLEAYALQGATVSAGNDHTDLWVELVTGGYFDLLGRRPLLGRSLSRADETDASPVAVVSEDYWRGHLGGERAAIGRPIRINDAPFTLIGVMPHSFGGLFFAHRFTIAVPITTAPLFDERIVAGRTVNAIGRLPRGTNDRDGIARFSSAFFRCCFNALSVSSALEKQKAAVQPHVIPPDVPYSASNSPRDTLDASPHVTVSDASRGLTWGHDLREPYRRVLTALMLGVVLLLLIACANVGTLLLARAESRGREFAVRLSLGASRARLVRQLMTESLELAIAGACLGLLLSWLGTTLLLHNLPGNALQLGDIIAWRVSPSILAFTAIVAIASTVVAGIWPARRASRADILAPLTGAERVRAHARRWSVESGLTVAQMSLALVLVTAATLFVATLRNLGSNDGGYHNRNVLLARVDKDSITRDAQAILDALHRLPGIEAVGIAIAAPVINDYWWWIPIEIPGYTAPPGERAPEANVVTPGFFAGTGIGLRGGRDFDVHDGRGAEPVVIVSESFARRYFGDSNPLGRTLTVKLRDTLTARIVGVANDAIYKDLHEAPSVMWYMPLTQWNAHARPQKSVAVAVRTARDPVELAPLVRRTIDGVAPGATIRKISSVGQLLDDALAKERFAAALGSLFGLVALGLAVIGVYGVIAYGVTRRTAEIGVRMALGASPRDALWLVLRQALVMAAVGIAIGLPLAYAASRVIASQLFGVQPGDPRVMAAAALILTAAGLIAGLIPGRRAAEVDPIVALRSD